MRSFSLFLPLALLGPLACSGEDDGPGGAGSGIGAAAAAGAAGNGSLAIGGRAGMAGKVGTAGQAGAPPAGGQAGGGGAGQAGIGGAGQAGVGGAGQAGVGGQAAGGAPVAPVCGDGSVHPAELCEGSGAIAACSAYLGDASPASQSVVCDGCYPSAASCLPFANGRLDAGLESDIDCGGQAPSRCGLGFACKAETDCEAGIGLTCVAGVCNEISLAPTTQALVGRSGVSATNGLTLRTLLPLPAGATVVFDAKPQAPGTGSVGASVAANELSVPAPHGRRATVKLSPSGVIDPAVVSIEYGATIGLPSLPDSTKRITAAGTLDLRKTPNFNLPGSGIEVQRGNCLVAGQTPPTFPSVGSAIDVPVGTPLCVIVKGLSGSLPLDTLRIGDHVATKAGFDRATLTIGDQPLFEGTPATAHADVVLTIGGGAPETFVLSQALRITAFTITGTSIPVDGGLGTPERPRAAAWESLSDLVAAGSHVQLTDTLTIAGPLTFPGRLDGYAGAELSLITNDASVGLPPGGMVQDVAVSAKAVKEGNTCLLTSNGKRAVVRDVTLADCAVGLRATTDVIVSRTNLKATGTAIAIGENPITSGSPPIGRVFGGSVVGSDRGIATTHARSVVLRTSFADAVVGLTVGENADATVVGGEIANTNVGINVTGKTGRLLVAGVTFSGKGDDPADFGMTADGGKDMAVTVRGGVFQELHKNAIRLHGPNTVDVFGATIGTSGSAASPANANVPSPAIDVLAGQLRLVGTTISGVDQTLIHVGNGPSVSQHGRLEIGAGSRLRGGDRSVFADGASEVVIADALLQGAALHALDLRTTGACSLARTFLVSSTPRPQGAPLVNVDNGLGVAPTSSFDAVRLQAGAGSTLLSSGKQCSSYADPVGGSYLTVAAMSAFCF